MEAPENISLIDYSLWRPVVPLCFFKLIKNQDVKINTVLCWLKDEEREYVQEYFDYIHAQKYKIISKIIEANDGYAFLKMVDKDCGVYVSIKEANDIIKQSEGKAEITAAVLEYMKATFSPSMLKAYEDEQAAIAFGSKVFTLADWKNIFAFQLNDSGITITKYKRKDPDLTLPTLMGKKILTAIGENAFYSCDELTSVSIPDTVKSIGNKAFALCTQLISVKFEGKIEEWHKIAKGEDCFSGSPVNTVICCDGETPI